MHYVQNAPLVHECREMHGILDAAAIKSAVDALCTCAGFRLDYWLLVTGYWCGYSVFLSIC